MNRKQLFAALTVLCLCTVESQVSAQDGQRRGARGGRGAVDTAPKVGDEAPLFKLDSLDGKSQTILEEYRGKKPVVLIFGSYT